MHPDDAAETEYEYFIFPDVYKNEICKGVNHTAVSKLLIDAGVLMPSACGTSATRSERLPGMPPTKCYRFNAGVYNVGSP